MSSQADQTETAYLALGSNVGDRRAHLRRAVAALRAAPDVEVVAGSPVYESAAHTQRPDEQQPDYLYAVLRLRTRLAPEALLGLTQQIEAEAGREPSAQSAKWAPRTLDLDLLVYGAETRRTERLALPHPRLGERRFVLRPLADLAPNLRVPAPFDTTVADLLRRCPANGPLRRASGDVLSF